jgi:hypothetical protein
MKDQRIPFIRKTLDSVLESLEATLRVKRWSGSDVPEPLRLAADRLVERLGTADRLGASEFRGSPSDMSRVTAMLAAMKRLDTAYVAYRSRIEKSPTEKDAAAEALDEEIIQVKSGMDAWAPS